RLGLAGRVQVRVPAAALEDEAGPAQLAGQRAVGATVRAGLRRRVVHLLERVRGPVALAAFVFVDGHVRSGESEPLQGAADEGGGDGEAAGEGGGNVLAVRVERADLPSKVTAQAILELALEAEVLEVLAPAEQVEPDGPARRSEDLAAEALAE